MGSSILRSNSKRFAQLEGLPTEAGEVEFSFALGCLLGCSSKMSNDDAPPSPPIVSMSEAESIDRFLRACAQDSRFHAVAIVNSDLGQLCGQLCSQLGKPYRRRNAPDR